MQTISSDSLIIDSINVREKSKLGCGLITLSKFNTIKFYPLANRGRFRNNKFSLKYFTAKPYDYCFSKQSFI